MKAGDKCRNVRGEKVHIINIFKEDDNDIVVFKKWNRYSKRWIHNADYLDLFMIGFDYGWKMIKS